ncbi:hypothetical protein Tco_0026799 [Tanacetum coccineum]
MPHDSPLPGGYTLGSIEGSMKLNELTDLCTKLVDRVTSLEKELKQTKEVHGKALTKLVKKVKSLEDSSKHGRMTKTAYEDIETRYAEVEYDLDQTEQHITPTKDLQSEEQNQEAFEAELSALSAAKILAEASKERVKTYNRRKRSTDSLNVSNAAGLFSTAEETDEEFARKVQEEKQTKALEQQEQERINLEVSGSMIRYQTLKKKPVSVAQARKNMMLRKYWKIIRVSNITEAYQIFEVPTEDMERALWVKLKRLYKPDKHDTLWKLQKYMHDPLTWRLYGSCAVHHVSLSRGHDIYMLTEKDYPLTTAVMGLMLSRWLQEPRLQQRVPFTALAGSIEPMEPWLPVLQKALMPFEIILDALEQWGASIENS